MATDQPGEPYIAHERAARERDLNAYDVLQVSPLASDEVIHAAYRALARGYHPDLNGSTDSRNMRRLNAAYRTLSDPDRRSAYDARLRALRSQDLRQQQTRRRVAEVTQNPRTARFQHTSVRTGRVPQPGSFRSGPNRLVLLATVVLVTVVLLTTVMGMWAIAAALDDAPLTTSFDQMKDVGQVQEEPTQPFLNP